MKARELLLWIIVDILVAIVLKHLIATGFGHHCSTDLTDWLRP